MRTTIVGLFVTLLLVSFAFAAMTPQQMQQQKDEYYKTVELYKAGAQLTEAQVQLLKEIGWPQETTPGEIDYAGGPDAYGYIFKDSDEPGGPVYNFVDISGTGTAINAGMTDDNAVGPYPIGFTFNFYGVGYSQFWVGSNGVLCLGDPAGYFTYSNTALPYIGTTIPTIFWCWDDFYVPGGGSVYYETLTVEGQNALVLMYDNVAHYYTGAGSMTGELILFEDGTFRTQYEEFVAPWPADTQTIGIQNPGPTISLQADFDLTPPNYPFAGLAIEFSVLPGDANVSGYVTDSVSGDPVIGANVFIGNGNSTTNNSGFYSIQDQFSGDNDVMITAAGYFTYYDVVTLDPGDNSYDFQMDALPPPWNQNYFTDFEADQGFFTGDGNWQWGTPVEGAYSGVNCWAINLAGEYNDNDSAFLTTATSFAVHDVTASLTYYHMYDYETGWDGYNLKVSTDGGNTWTLITPVGGYNDDSIVGLGGEPGFTMTQGTWTPVVFDLSAYNGQEIKFQFHHGSDSSVHTGYSGAAIDDFDWYAGYEYQLILTALGGYTVQPGGGVVTYSAELINNTGAATVMQAWTWAGLPNGGIYGPIAGPVNVNIAPGSTIIPQLALQVPPGAPGGLYDYHGAIGTFPNNIVSESVFWFWKLGPGADNTGGSWTDTPWDVAMNEMGPAVELPQEYSVGSIYPNPFNPTTNISISLPDASDLSVRVFNIMGQMVAELANGRYNAGQHDLVLDGSSLASGLYFVHTEVPGQLNNIQKITLLK